MLDPGDKETSQTLTEMSIKHNLFSYKWLHHNPEHHENNSSTFIQSSSKHNFYVHQAPVLPPSSESTRRSWGGDTRRREDPATGSVSRSAILHTIWCNCNNPSLCLGEQTVSVSRGEIASWGRTSWCWYWRYIVASWVDIGSVTSWSVVRTKTDPS